MNLVYKDPTTPLRVLLVNPVDNTSSLLGVKLMRGVIFGMRQLLDLTFLVYENDFHHANRLKWELEAGGFPCYNRISITHNMPKLSDADVFIFNTGLTNLNSLDGNDLQNIETFNTFYLLMTVAENLEMPPPSEPAESQKKYKEKKTFKPIIVVDGLVALDVLITYSKNLPSDIFFCPTPIDGIAKSILGDHLKVHCADLNLVHVWAADDEIFHVDVESPVYIHEKTKTRAKCEWHMMAESEYEELGIDFIQFNAAWLKRDFIDKIYAVTSHHPNGYIYKANKCLNTLRSVWATRDTSLPIKGVEYANLGIISDGSLGTIKGLPYFLPVIFKGDNYTVNLAFKDSVHLKQEIKRINKTVLDNHKQLMAFCKKFHEKNIIKREFIPASEESYITEVDTSDSLSDD